MQLTTSNYNLHNIKSNLICSFIVFLKPKEATEKKLR